MNWKTNYYKNRIICDWYYHTKNFGDYLNKWLLSKISGKEICHVDSEYDFNNINVYACIGSILQKRFKYKTEIWGAGAMYPNKPFFNIKKVHAVRGKLTRYFLLENNIDCPEIYGDPAILLPLFYTSEIKSKTHTIGLLPHYIDQDSVWVEKHKNDYDIKFINILDPIEKVIDDIHSCCWIMSSSLHGLIAADAYGIPSLWVEFSDNVRGEGFKFRDYYSGIGQNDVMNINPVNLKKDNFSIYQIEKCVNHHIKINKTIQDKLLNACPFKDGKE